MKVQCINDKNKPTEIPIEKWIKYGEMYTVIKVVTTLDNQPGFVLKEIELGEDTFPYDCFNPKRFAQVEENIEQQIENAINKLISETCPIEN